MLRVAKLLPIPRRYESKSVRRYGFHGLSYEYLVTQPRMQGRVILAHLGNGASLAAHRGKRTMLHDSITRSSRGRSWLQLA